MVVMQGNGSAKLDFRFEGAFHLTFSHWARSGLLEYSGIIPKAQ
jgi:hypothetical protein